MENASKALLIAAEVLVGIVIISIGAALFSMFSSYSRDTNERITAAQLAEFNNNFYKYYGDEETQEGYNGPIRVTIHEIITLANFAKANNEKYDLYDKFKDKFVSEEMAATMYVRVELDEGGKKHYVETWDEEKANNYMLNHSIKTGTDLVTGHSTFEGKKYYQMVSEPLVSEETGRVYYVKFKEI